MMGASAIDYTRGYLGAAVVWDAKGASPDHSGGAFDADVLVLHFGIRHLQKN